MEIKGTPTFSAITSGRLETVAIFKGSKSRFGKVAFNCKIEREILLRLTNYGPPITTDATDFCGRPVEIVLTEKPAYGGSSITSPFDLNEGDYLIIRSSPNNPSVETGKPTTEFRALSYIVIISVTTSKP